MQLLIELYSGLRMGEINALKPENLDFKKRVIHVKATVSRGFEYKGFIKDGTKTIAGKREVPMNQKVEPYLREALKKMIPNKEKLIFCDVNNKKLITTSQVNAFYKRLCESNNIPFYGQHSLRHTFATRCIEAGVPAIVLKNWLGHRDIHITLDTYADVFSRMNFDAMDKLDMYIDALNGPASAKQEMGK